MDRENAPASSSLSEIEAIPKEWLDEFEAAARWALPVRMKYAFIRTYKPVLDDAAYRRNN